MDVYDNRRGAYINLNTPVELYPNRIRYVDMEVDVCVLPDGDVKAMHEELLERACSDMTISSGLLEIVERKVKHV